MGRHHPVVSWKLEKCALALALLLVAGCHKKRVVVGTQPAASTSARPPVDHLAPGELAPGKDVVFGMHVPRSMTVDRRYPDAAHISGSATPESVANYVRKRVIASRVEIGAARTVFPAVKIKGGNPNKVYRIEVIASPGRTKLVIRDITKPPMARGLTQAQRWRRAGLTPEGQPLDPKHLQ